MSEVHTDKTLYLKCVSDGRQDGNDHFDESHGDAKQEENTLWHVRGNKINSEFQMSVCVCCVFVHAHQHTYHSNQFLSLSFSDLVLHE